MYTVRLCTILSNIQGDQSLFLLQNSFSPLADTLLLYQFKYLPLALVVSILSGNHMGEVPFWMRPEQPAWISGLLLFLLVLADLGIAGLELAKNWTSMDSNQKRMKQKVHSGNLTHGHSTMLESTPC